LNGGKIIFCCIEEYMPMLDDDIDFGLLIGAGGAVRSFKQGATIFKEGDQASELYVIQNGSVRADPRSFDSAAKI
jgi:CRP-like cAMP-binding protein